MPPFVYQPYTNPYGPSIAEALQHQGDLQASAALQLGDIQAANTARQGALQAQMWGTLGNAFTAIPAQARAAREQAVREQTLQLQNQALVGGLQDTQRARDARDAFSKAIGDTPLKDDQTYDIPGILKAADPRFSADYEPYVQHLQTFNSAVEQQAAKEQQQLQSTAARIIAAGSPLVPTDNFLVAQGKAGKLPADQVTQLRQGIHDDPTQAEAVLRLFAGPQKLIEHDPTKAQVDPLTNKIIVPAVPKAKFEQAKENVVGPNGEPLTFNADTGWFQTADGTIVKNPQIKKVETPKSYQKSSVLLDGKPAEVLLDPSPGGKVYTLDQQPIDNAATRIRPIPPASTIINNQRDAALQNLPTWAFDDTRPAGPDANKLDATIQRTPNGLYQDAMNVILQNRYPPTGRGNDTKAQALRAAIDAKVGAIAASAGMDVPQLQAFYRANGASLAQQQKVFDTASANIATADRNAALLEQALAKMPDTGSPLFNQPLRAFSTKVAGNPDMAPIATYLASVQNEYGKLINSASGTAAALSDSARHEAQNLIDPNATVASMLGSIQALKNEGNNRLLSTGDQIKAIQGRMQINPRTGAAPGGGGVKILSITPVP